VTEGKSFHIHAARKGATSNSGKSDSRNRLLVIEDQSVCRNGMSCYLLQGSAV